MKRMEIERLFSRLYGSSIDLSIDLMEIDGEQIIFESRDSWFSVFISDNIIV